MTENAMHTNGHAFPEPEPSPPFGHPLALLLQEGDDVVADLLPRWVKPDKNGPHDDIFWQPSVQERVGAMEDDFLTVLLMTLAQEAYLGLGVLFDERLLPRIAAIRARHLYGTFLPYACRIPGFKESRRHWEALVEEAVGLLYQQGAHAILIPGIDLKEEAIDWLWEPYIAKKAITILDGDPGVGKTMLACQLAASVSQGYPLPDQVGHMTMGSPDQGEVLMIGMEDHLSSVVRTRLLLCQADMSKITFCNEIVDADGMVCPFTLDDLPLLVTYLETSHPALVYIDAIQGVLGGKTDIGSPNKIKALIGPLDRLAKEYNCAIVCSRHPSKPGQNVARLIHRGMGSQSFIGSARSGLFVESDPGDKDRSMLFHYKSNMGMKGRTQLFSKTHGMFEWAGVSRIGEEVLFGAGRGPNPYALLDACFWLEKQLSSGLPRPCGDLEAEAKEDEVSESSLKRAKKILGVQSRQAPGDGHGGWLWSLPPLTLITTSEASEASEASESSESPDLESSIYSEKEERADQPEEVSTVFMDRVYTTDTHDQEEKSRTTLSHVDTSGAQEAQEAQEVQEASEEQKGVSPISIPCAVCGQATRWNDHGIWRCRQCWPTP